MTDILEGLGDRLSSASPPGSWIIDYARGRYTEVVRAWAEARAGGGGSSLLAEAELAEAVGWSVALTKSWDAFPALRDDLRAHPQHAPLLAVLDAWHAIHEARYDTAVHVARGARAPLVAPGASSKENKASKSSFLIIHLGYFWAALTLAAYPLGANGDLMRLWHAERSRSRAASGSVSMASPCLARAARNCCAT